MGSQQLPFREVFKYDKVLGKGGFGQVFLVRPYKDQSREFALKVVNVQSLKMSKQEYKTEFDVMVELQHSNIIAMYASYEEIDPSGNVIRYGIAMQFSKNGDLSTFLDKRQGRPLSQEKFVLWMEQLSSAIKYIHSKKIIHRDLKPENTLLSNDMSLLISDFGIAKIMTEKYTNTCIGTPAFVAPEVLSGKRYDEKVDIYSLGKMFICMATVNCSPGDTSSIPKFVDETVREIIKRSLCLKPAYRPSAEYIHRTVSALLR